MTPVEAGRGTIAVTGASGFIGSELVTSLRADGQRVLRLVRRRAEAADELEWDPDAGRIDAAGLEGVRAVVHLAGETIDQRWTESARRRLRESRVGGTRLLAESLAGLSSAPEVLVCGSAVGYYGADRRDELLTEESGPGSDFLGELGVAWEGAAAAAREVGMRVVHPRFGVVLGRGGGALRRMLPAFRLGAGGRLGSGRQWMSWISLVDAVRAIRFLIDTPSIAGPCNAVAPEPVTNAEFTEELGRALGRPTVTVVPAFALRIVFGDMAEGTILASQRVQPRRLLENGFEFLHPTIEVALRSIFRSSPDQ